MKARSIYKITDTGLTPILYRRCFYTFAEENIFCTWEDGDAPLYVTEEEYLAAVQQTFDKPQAYISHFSSPDGDIQTYSGTMREMVYESLEDLNDMDRGYITDSPLLDKEMNWDKNGYFYHDGIQAKNPRGNLRGYSVVAQNDIWRFYQGFEGLYRIPTDKRFSGGETLISNVNGRNYNVYEDYLYFEEGKKIYRMRFDGSEKEYLAEGWQPQVANDGWIYHTTDGDYFAIWKMRLDGSDRQIVTEARAYCLNVVDDAIYFLDRVEIQETDSEVWPSGKICMVNTDGTEYQKLLDPVVSNLLYYDGFLFFTAHDGIYYSNDFCETVKRMITSESLITSFNITSGGTLFFCCGNNALYRSSIYEAGEPELIAQVQNGIRTENIFVLGEDAYVTDFDIYLNQVYLNIIKEGDSQMFGVSTLPY